MDDLTFVFVFVLLFRQPIFTAVNVVNDFADQFIKMEAENAQLRKYLAAAKSSAERIEAANRLTEEAWQKNEDLMKELTKVKAELEEEVKHKETAKTLAKEQEERLCRAVESLLGKLSFLLWPP